MAIKLFANYEHGKVGIMDMSRGPWDLSRWACHIPVRLSRGLATLRVPFPFPLAAGICRTACATSLPARHGGPCKAVGNQGVARPGPLFRLCPMPYKSKLLTALGINGISIALRC